MRISVLSLGLVAALVATAVHAQSRPYAPRMSCRAVAGLVAARGAVVISTGPTTYDRYVRDRRFCEITEVTQPAWVPTADSPQCFIGYTCKEAETEDFFPRWR
ncbi:hypothetical protein QNA08_15020 [Chelatococcus sp. SYSU_G07232]|uniref:Secreted protein n=1 Tax=Chelatococcus albus TaxID=3047466 RepID=A0ABT7AJJ5_9HYPH|nr:hypothetical protein [Chelatococcus sp. SYSU_G07232]MDJ1159546.1 hypothetical protein [Chelatococcus sp. SYSU_G07232]